MQVIDGLENIGSSKSASVTVGSFDGLHLGHQRILDLMQKSNSSSITVLTFEPHPQTVVRPDIPPPPLLTSREERIELFREFGIDRLVFTSFNEKFAAMSAEDYVQNVLVQTLGVKQLFTGPNHRFGKDRRGDLDLLRAMGNELGFNVFVVDPVMFGDEVISSRRIRKKLASGSPEIAHKMLGKPYYMVGVVIRGEGRGKKLGFPTANLNGLASGKLMPPPGIYATVTEVGDQRWPSVSHIGPRPTFAGSISTIESHLIGFDGNLYDFEVKIGLVQKIRDIVAYSDVSALIDQMEIDRQEAIKLVGDMGYSNLSHSDLNCLTQNTSIS